MKNQPEISGRSIGRAELVEIVEASRQPAVRKRDMLSAVSRVLKMGGVWAGDFVFTAASVRALIASIKPAAHGLSAKSFSNIQSNLRAALREAGIIDAAGGYLTKADSDWGPLMAAAEEDKSYLALSRFAGYCARHSVCPDTVDDSTVLDFHGWLVARTLEPRPDAVVRKIPKLWNRAAANLPGWPATRLNEVQIGLEPRKTSWSELPEMLRREAEAYLELRADPDPFDETPDRPTRPLAPATLRLHKEHIRLAFDVLQEGQIQVKSLADLVTPDNVKAILRHYLGEAPARPNAFATSIAKTLIAVAKYQVRVSFDELARLKKLAARLPAVPFDLTAKNKSLVQALHDERKLASLVALPETLFAEAKRLHAAGKPCHPCAHVALAIALLLIAPMRSQNLIALNWRTHVREFSGPRGALQLLIPASETKTGRQDHSFELDGRTSEMLRWNRKVLLPASGADPDGDVFALPGGKRRGQSSLANGIASAIEKHVGIKMTAHQFRHLAADRYLEKRPEDFETVRQLLGHAYGKTTQIYAGRSGERASRAYAEIVMAKAEALKREPKGKMRRRRPKKSDEI
ncbi:tyrosine-type recombinase/integrase [Mesorhizobium marinum]|uniref:tyrosine-type recombinase/integrase n=1 Tax=Mesorhizobium marinum TaxID=3228790 RepID=UPI0034662F95